MSLNHETTVNNDSYISDRQQIAVYSKTLTQRNARQLVTCRQVQDIQPLILDNDQIDGPAAQHASDFHNTPDCLEGYDLLLMKRNRSNLEDDAESADS